MLAIRHHPELSTVALASWLRSKAAYDVQGRMGAWLATNGELPRVLEGIAEEICPGIEFDGVVLQCYRDGNAATDCHTDLGYGIGFILSLGATRTFRIHRVGDDFPVKAGCIDRDLDVCEIECVNGTVIVMDEAFHAHWHHQIAPDPQVTGERLSLVFRTKAKG